VQKPSCENEFDLHENEHVAGTHFHMNSFVRRIVLTQRQKATFSEVACCIIQFDEKANALARLSFVGHITKGGKG